MCIDAKSIPLASWLCLSLVVSYPLCWVTLPYVTLRLENLHCQLQLLGKKMSLEILHGKKKKKSLEIFSSFSGILGMPPAPHSRSTTRLSEA